MLDYANKTELTALENKLMTQINAVRSDVTALTNECAEKFGVIETDIETIQQSLTSLEEADKGVAGLISALEERATEIETDIEILENSVTGSIETVNSKIAELSEELTAVKTAIQNLQAKDLQIDDAIASLNASMEADLAEQLAQIEGLSESLQQHIQTATTTFATQEALSGLSAEIEQLKTDYEARFNLIESTVAFTVITAGLYGLGSGSIEIVCCRRADSLRAFISWSLALPVESHWMRAWMIDESGRTIMTVSRMVSVTDSVFSVTSVV